MCGSVLVNRMPKSARYHIDRANSIVFTSKRLPLQPVSSERNHQVADKFRKMSCLNVYRRKRGRVGVKQCMHSLDCLLSVFFDDYMSKLFPIFYLANFVCFYPSKYKAFLPSKQTDRARQANTILFIFFYNIYNINNRS